MFPAINRTARSPLAEPPEMPNPPEASNETDVPPASAVQQCAAAADPALALPPDAQQAAAAMRMKALGLADVLAHHLACPQSKARFEYVPKRLDHDDLTRVLGANRNGRSYITSKDVPPQAETGCVGTSIAEDELKLDFNSFTNVYSPDTWWMESNFREHKAVPYFASDVTLVQYYLMSRKYGFEGVLPKQIVRANISNAETLQFFSEAGDAATLGRFLAETPNGKHTQRVLDALQMRATHLEWDKDEETATISVELS